MSTRKARQFLRHVFLLGAITAAVAKAADFQHDLTGNLTPIVAAPGVRPTLPAGRSVPVFTDPGQPLSLVPPAQSAGVSSYQWFRDGIAIVGATNDVLLRFTTTALGQAWRYLVNRWGGSALQLSDPQPTAIDKPVMFLLLGRA